MKNFDIIYIKGHIEVFDKMGNFVFSADNYKEACENLILIDFN